MKNLETLIHELCPDGVEFVKLAQHCKIYGGTHQTPKYQKTGIPFISVENIKSIYDSKKYISQEAYDAYKIKPKVGDVFMTRIGSIGACAVFTKEADIAYYVSLALLRPDSKVLNSGFLKYIIESSWGKKELRKRTLVNAVPIKVNKQDIGKIEIPLPPIEVQTEIVRILDKFTSLEAELEAELDCRKRQYEYYRDKLLSFDNVGEQEVEWKKIGEICDTLSGFPFDSSKFQTSGIKLMRGKNVKRGYFDFNEDDDRYWESPDGLEKYLLQDKDIIISMDGSLVGKSFAMLSKKHLPLLLVQRVARVRAKNVNQNYLFHNIAHRFSGYVDKKKTGGAIPHVSMKDIQNFSIPVPSLQEQERIATILDRFESLTTSLQSGLPAEITARRQQYEHYRDKLLTFKRKGAA